MSEIIVPMTRRDINLYVAGVIRAHVRQRHPLTPDQMVVLRRRDGYTMAHRREFHLTQNDLAALIDLERGAFARRMRGQIPFRVAELYRIACVLGLPVAGFYPPLPDRTEELADR